MRLSPRTSVPRMGRTLGSVSCRPTLARSCSWPRKTGAASGKTFGMFIVLGLQHCHLKGKEHSQVRNDQRYSQERQPKAGMLGMPINLQAC